MNKLKFIILLTIIFILSCGFTTNNNLYTNENFILENIKEITSNTREFGSTGELKACEYLNNKLKEYNYNTYIQKFPVYKQEIFQLNSNTDYFNLNPLDCKQLGVAKNIIATQPNFDKNKKTIYLVAHYDTTADTIGVIDNATGAAAILDIARVINNHKLPYNIKIVLFSAEEYAIYGSKYFVSNLTEKEKDNILGVINIDMIGEKNAGNITIRTSYPYNNIISILMKDKFKNKFEFISGVNSDQLSFYMGKIPAVTFTNKEPKKFNGNDQFDFLDVDQIKDTSDSIIEFLSSFNLKKYHRLLDKDNGFNLNIQNCIFYRPKGFKLVSIRELLLENGFGSEIIYDYRNNEDKKFILREKDRKFFNVDRCDDFIKLDNYNNFYKITNKKSLNDETEIIYRLGQHYGVLRTNTTLDESMKFFKEYYNEYRKNTFG